MVKNHNAWINDSETTTSRMGLKRNTSPAIAKTPPSASDAYPNTWGSTHEPSMTTPSGKKTAGAVTMGERCWMAAIRSRLINAVVAGFPFTARYHPLSPPLGVFLAMGQIGFKWLACFLKGIER